MVFTLNKFNTHLLLAGFFLLSLLSQYAAAHGMSEADKLAIIEGGNLRYMWLGASHMLSGFDHLAFVFGIIFFLNNLRDIVKYVTAFTLGHSVTLIFATFNAIQLNYFLVDAVIALSVCYIAFANIDGFRKYLNIAAPNMMLMITGLGLIHGFGLSSRLQELPLSQDSLLLNIISFNLGIELGQLAALVVMLLLIAAWRHTHFFKAFSLLANYLLILSGLLLFLQQMHGYTHNTDPQAYQSAAGSSSAYPAALSTDQWKDTILINLPARGETEYKLSFQKHAPFEYSWATAGAELFYDFHAEPAADSGGSFKSFKKATANQSSGSLTSLFAGMHGWYWKNNNPYPVTVTLKTKGEYQRMDKKPIRAARPVKRSTSTSHESIF